MLKDVSERAKDVAAREERVRTQKPRIITQTVTHHKEQPSLGAFGSYEPAASPAPTRSPPPHYGAQPTPAADPFTDPYDVAEAKAEDLYV